MSRRSVCVGSQFFIDLDSQLGESRGPNGEPSASDFLLVDLPTLSEEFAERFDELPTLYVASFALVKMMLRGAVNIGHRVGPTPGGRLDATIG